MPKSPVIHSKPYAITKGVVQAGSGCGCHTQTGGKNGKGRRKLRNTLRKVNRGLKKTKAISRTAMLLDQLGVPHASEVARIASQQGYGQPPKRRKRKPQAKGPKF